MDKKILITAPVHQTEEVFIEYLNSLNHLYIPKEFQVKRFFYLYNCSILKKLLSEEEYVEILDNSTYNFFSHDFKKDNYSALSYMRTAALEKARKENYDYVFSVDSDILLHPKCLEFLLQDNKDIVGMLNYTRNITDRNKILPNCYDAEYWKWWENPINLYNKQLVERGIISATVLISRKIIENEKINYYPIPNIECSQWEDYAFSLKAHIAIPDLKIFLDTRLPSRHLYQKKDYIRWIKEKNKYE